MVCFWIIIGSIIPLNVILAETAVTYGQYDVSASVISSANVKFVIHIPEKLSLTIEHDSHGKTRMESESNISGKQVSVSQEGWVISVP
jgi:hypothetical protein